MPYAHYAPSAIRRCRGDHETVGRSRWKRRKEDDSSPTTTERTSARNDSRFNLWRPLFGSTYHTLSALPGPPEPYGMRVGVLSASWFRYHFCDFLSLPELRVLLCTPFGMENFISSTSGTFRCTPEDTLVAHSGPTPLAPAGCYDTRRSDSFSVFRKTINPP